MSPYRPDVTPEEITSAEVTIKQRVERIKKLAEENNYSGRYLDMFVKVADELYEVFDIIDTETQDGFQFRDLEPILTTAAPEIISAGKKIYLWSLEGNRQAIFRDLIVFIYYELEKRMDASRFIKFFLRIFVKVWGAKELAKGFIMAIDYMDGLLDTAKSNLPPWVAEIIDLFD